MCGESESLLIWNSNRVYMSFGGARFGVLSFFKIDTPYHTKDLPEFLDHIDASK